MMNFIPFMNIYRKVLCANLVELTKDVADRVGVQKVIDFIEELLRS